MLKNRNEPVILGAELRIFNAQNDGRLGLCTDAVPPPSAIRSFVTRETKTASIFESIVMKGIIDNGISAYYEPDVYALGIDSVRQSKNTRKLVVNARSLRTPDFVSSLVIMVKGAEMQVIFEPHDPLLLPPKAKHAEAAYDTAKRYLNNMHEFKLLYPDFYTVMLSHYASEDILRIFDIDVADICNEFWHIPTRDRHESDIIISKMIREIKSRKNVYDVGPMETLYALNAAAVKKIKRFESVAISDALPKTKGKRKGKKNRRVDTEEYINDLPQRDIQGFTYENGKFYPSGNHARQNDLLRR